MPTEMIPLSTWYPAMHTRWQARLAELRNAGVKVDFPFSSRIGWVIHHTVGGTGQNATAYARQVADQHWAKWKRPGGYNFLVGWDGQIREMSGYTHEGAHAGTNYWNEATLGLAFQGTFTDTPPPGYMLEAGTAFINQTPIPGSQWGHRQVRPEPTTCPGDALFARLPLEADMASPAQKLIVDLAFNLFPVEVTGDPNVWKNLDEHDSQWQTHFAPALSKGAQNLYLKVKNLSTQPGGVTESQVKAIINASKIVPPSG